MAIFLRFCLTIPFCVLPFQPFTSLTCKITFKSTIFYYKRNPSVCQSPKNKTFKKYAVFFIYSDKTAAAYSRRSKTQHHFPRPRILYIRGAKAVTPQNLAPIKEGGCPKMGCFCNFFEDNKCLWIIIIALILLSCNGCGCGNGCGCD